MPSDPRIEPALAALRRQTDGFRAALATTVHEVREYLASHCRSGTSQAERLGTELGPFGAARIDVERFASLFSETEPLDSLTADTVERALGTLMEIAARDDGLFVVEVTPERTLRDAVAGTLAEIGRVFGASRVIELARTGRYKAGEHARSLGSFPYGRWSKTERRLAPPLVIAVDGANLHAAGLAEFLDGGQKFVLLIRGESTPAPLVRLITPSTFVLQADDPAALGRLAAWDGPGVAALVPDGAAHFVHDPAAGTAVFERLTIGREPDGEPRRALGGLSRVQQLAELEQLRALAARPAVPPPTTGDGTTPAAASEATAADPVGKLAAWLLQQADLTAEEV